jgi:ABC-2 type transport system ATP-binding protein
MIELRRLYRYFGVTKAVHDISFEVHAGQVLGYIGPNGAGKTTSMRILATLDLPTFGDAFIDGFSCINDPDHRVRKRLGFMPDYFGTYADVNCYEYLDFFARSYGLMGKERHRALKYTMSFTRLDELAHKPIRGLSKGMKQRLCLGRAMIHDPAVLILDEPANGLDPRARIDLREMIHELAANGKTILVSSHILTELAEMCDQVAIIERGQLLAVGSVEEIRRQQQPHREVKVRVLGGAGALAQWLGTRADIGTIHLDCENAQFAHTVNREAKVGLLKDMVLAGFPIAEFASHSVSLEDVFLAVTQGAVQ